MGSSQLITELVNALSKHNINTSHETIENLISDKQWIYKSVRVETIQQFLKQDPDILYSIFNSDHHIDSSSKLFDFLDNPILAKKCVLFGHKAQGKSQFLFFVFKLLQACGEVVVYLDRTATPDPDTRFIDVESPDFCGNEWISSIRGVDKDSDVFLNKFMENGQPEDFKMWFHFLKKFAMKSSKNVWVIVDEVLLFEEMGVQLPEEQTKTAVKWIVTGSAGIGSWTAKRHLRRNVFDMPLFEKEVCMEFAQKLCNALGLNLEEALDDVVPEGISDWLEEKFGGVIGYTAEMVLALAQGESISSYMLELSSRILALLEKNVKPSSEANNWLSMMASSVDPWIKLRNTGLCGSEAPRGVILQMVLQSLGLIAGSLDEEYNLIVKFRRRFQNDAGLDGCLLERQEVLKLCRGESINATRISKQNAFWRIQDDSVSIPTTESVGVYNYIETACLVDPTSVFMANVNWKIVILPPSFPVVDVIVVHIGLNPIIYGVQITRSASPFTKHRTFSTCSERSKRRLEGLWTVIHESFELDDKVPKYFVMLAPNCKEDKFTPDSDHEGDYYFSPVLESMSMNDKPVVPQRSGKRQRITKSK